MSYLDQLTALGDDPRELEQLYRRADAAGDRDAFSAAIEERYRRQYAALDTLVASMNTTGSFLSQQLLSLQNLTSNG